MTARDGGDRDAVSESCDSADGDGATAFVPGHVTGFFSTHPAGDPAAAGSRGAGLTLSMGVEVTVTPGSRTALNGSSADVEAIEHVCDALGVDPAIAVETELPIGAGFGVSGAAALGTAFAANAVFDCGRSENELVTIAHAAEVDAGTGLGDVVAQARGGIPIRIEPGAPEYGLLDGIPSRARVEYVTFGELSTEAVLADDTSTLSAAGERALSELLNSPTLPTLMAASRTFAREADLLVPDVAEAIEAVDAAGGEAAMAMLGRTVFAVGTGLSDAGYDPVACYTHSPGASLIGDAE